MTIKRYKKDVYVEAVEFVNTPENHTEIINFCDLPISIEYTSSGVQLRVIKGTYIVIVANLGEYIVKDANGKLVKWTKEELEFEYELLEDEES